MKLVLIHGRSQEGKDPTALQKVWEDAFEAGLEKLELSRPSDLEIVFPFYGDVLDTLVKQFDAPLLADVSERGGAQDADEEAFRAEFLTEIANKSGLTQGEIEAHYTGDVARERGAQNWKWVHAILKALDRSNRIGEALLDSITRDVYLYLSKKIVRRRIDEIIATHIVESPCVVVGHSLGSIVGYNVLRNTSSKDIRFITLGSPLGVKSIKSRLDQVEMPSSTIEWYNARDRQDVVSLYPLNGEHFNTSPGIHNYDDVDNQTPNQHGIVGYLPDPWVAKMIYNALTQPF